jgi:hypothetical protein
MKVSGYNTNLTGDSNSANTASVNAQYVNLVTNPNFSGVSAFTVNLQQDVGCNQYGYDSGGTWTQSKTTPIAVSFNGTYAGSGERFIFGLGGVCYGMSDAFLMTGQFAYAGGPIAGDEGQGFSPAIYCYQMNSLALAFIQSVTRTTT